MFPSTWTRLQCERASCQHDVAVEFGYATERIQYHLLMNKGPFSNAGDLIMCLIDAESVSLEKPSTPPKPRVTSIDLRLETWSLMQQLKCLVCHDRPRSHVLLPCSELTLCSTCVSRARVCPKCHTQIETTIQTYM